MNRITKEEKNNILMNAVTSFVHGVEHLVKYKKGEKNIKFSIIHTFNAIELIVKAYLGSINEALLWPLVDKENNKTADISVLIARMKRFSEVHFNEDLEESIEKLRIKRNNIEHKKFILENEKEDIRLLIYVIYELRVFCNKNIDLDLKEDLTEEIMDELDNVRSEFDISFKKILAKIQQLREKGYVIEECPDCLNKTIPYKKVQSTIECYYCVPNNKFFVQKCDCGEWFIERKGLFVGTLCHKCTKRPTEEDIKEENELVIEMDTIEHDRIIREYPVEEYK